MIAKSASSISSEAHRVLRAPCVRCDGDDAVAAEPEVAKVASEELLRRHVVDRDREEALDLARVQVHGQNAVGAGALDHVGEEAARDRLARLRLTVLPRVREPRDHRRDPLRRGELGRLDHEEKLHDVLVDGATPGLDEEDVSAANRFAVATVRLAVGERRELDLAELDAELLRDPRCERGMRSPREHHQPLLRREGDRVARGHRYVRDICRFEPRQCLLNRAAFHRALPC